MEIVKNEEGFVLSVKDRVVLLAVMKQESGRMSVYRTIKAVLDKVSLSEEEHTRAEFLQPDEEMWKNNFDTGLSFTEQQLAVIRRAIVNLERKGQVNIDTFPLFERFGVKLPEEGE